MRNELSRLAFDGVSLRGNVLSFGGSDYAVSAIAGIHFWEDNRSQAMVRAFRKASIISAVVTAVLYILVELSMRNVSHPASGLGIVALILLYPAIATTIGLVITLVVVWIKSLARRRAANGRLTVTFDDGNSHIISGYPEDLLPLKAAISDAVASK